MRAMGKVVLPADWPAPAGYTPGMMAPAAGRMLAVSGQLGADQAGHVTSKDFLAQFDRAVDNVVAVVQAAGGRPADIISFSIFVLDRLQYLASTTEIALAWRRRTDAPYPAVTVVEVNGLIVPGALVEIQALAVLAASTGQ